MRWPSRIALATSLLLAAASAGAASIGLGMSSGLGMAQDREGSGGSAAADRSRSEGSSSDRSGDRAADRALVARSTVTAPPSVLDAPPTGEVVRQEPATRPEPIEGRSISVGRHNAGRLLFARTLLESEHLRLKRPTGGTNHGTDEIVALLERAAAEVAARHPGHRLTVGDISRPRGGRFSPHRSHRSGRDVDIGFYVIDPEGSPLYLDRFVDFRADGTSRVDPRYRFDDARNWALVEAMVSQVDVPVQYMFVWRPLRQRLLDHAARIGAPQEIIDRAAAVLDQPSRGGRHEDHFHMRIYCPATDRPRCTDEPPFHAWVPRPSAEEMVAIRAAASRSRQARARAERRDRRARERARARRAARRAVASAAAANERAADALEETPGG